MSEWGKGCNHKVRTLRAGSRDRYECLECGRRLRILNGVIVARTSKEAWEYINKKGERMMAEAKAKIEAERG